MPRAGPSAQQEAEYLELYRDMQRQAEVAAHTAAPGAPAPAPIPSPEAFVAALASAAADAPDEDGDAGADDDFEWPGLSLTRAQLLNFRLSSWLPLLRRHTMPTRQVPLPEDFVAYLMEDGVWIPEELAPVQPGNFLGRDNADDTAAERREEAARWRATVEEIHSSDDEEEEAAEEAAAAKQRARQSQPFFPELVAQLQSHISELGGSVFPSLDWHAPTDASWISTERVAKCSSVGDVLLLLKSSDKVQTEVEEPFADCSRAEAAASAAGSNSAAASSADVAVPAASAASFVPTLALRKWSTLHPSKLFRCFVYRGQLLAISQLDTANYYAFLQGLAEQDAIQDAIEGWMEDEGIAEILAERLDIQHAIMDLYLDTSERVWIVKLKPFWPKRTDALLFSWKELHALAVAHDDSEEAQRQQRADAAAVAPSALVQPAVPAASDAAASSSNSLTLPASWPSNASLSVPFRVVTQEGAGLDVLRAVGNMAAQLPSDGFDVSDGEAIERWIQRVEKGDLKQH